MILKMKFRKCLKVFNFKLLFIFILFTTSCSGSEDSFLPIKAELINGGEFNSEEFIGMPLVINFWYPSCPPCAKELPTLVKFDNQDEYKVKFLGIVHNSLVDKKEDSIRLIDKFNIKYQNIYDENGDLVNDFNVLGFPTTLFFDKNHKLSKKWTGYLDEENLIEQLKKINN